MPALLGSAVSLVAYDDDLDGVMKYVFGTALVCRDMDTARAVTFDKRVALKTVTPEGDVFDPSGTLSGGGGGKSGAGKRCVPHENIMHM